MKQVKIFLIMAHKNLGNRHFWIGFGTFFPFQNPFQHPSSTAFDPITGLFQRLLQPR